MRFILFIFFAWPAFGSPTFSSDTGCETLLKSVITQGYSAQDVSAEVSENVRTNNRALKNIRGYAILVGTMVGSAALSAHLTSHLPTKFAFLSQLLTQISTLGIYVFGAPIWEPISSGFRKLAFGVSQDPLDREPHNENQRLENIWFQTQENYSLNSQMSRNIINLFISSTKQNFYEAFRAMHSNDGQYAVTQVAEAAIRLRTLFKDVPPDDPSVATAVRTAFGGRFEDAEFRKNVLEEISKFDSTALTRESQVYYSRLVKAWF